MADSGGSHHSDERVVWLCPTQRERDLLASLVPFSDKLEGIEQVKQCQSRRVVKTVLPSGRTAYIKQYRVRSWPRRAASLIHASKARREYQVSLAAARQGIPVAAVLGAAEVWRNGFLVESYIAHEAVEPAVSLLTLLRGKLGHDRASPSPALADRAGVDRESLITSLARFLVFIQEKGFNHDDLRAQHILLRQPLQNPPQFVLIDLDGARFYSGPLGLEAIVHNLTQLNRSLWGPIPTAAERLQFLREFTKVHPRLSGRRVAQLWKRIAIDSVLREVKKPRGVRLWHQARFELSGQVPSPLRKALKQNP